ncbi:MAG: glycosyltransferase [Aquaticitalea sp.]
MRILLIGEFSRLHNSLKEGLVALGHEVVLVGSGDQFKKYPVDLNIESSFFNKGLPLFIRKIIFKFSKIDIAHSETAYRFKKFLAILNDFDIIQLINEDALEVRPTLQIPLLEKLIEQNGKMFLLCCGDDYISTDYNLQNKLAYSVLTPYLKDKSLKKEFDYSLKYVTEPYKKLHEFIYKNSEGVIATDMDYHIPLQNHEHYLGMIPNPINIDLLKPILLSIDSKIVIFHGINKLSSTKKGSPIIEKALAIVKQKYSEKIVIKTTYSLPYEEYIKIYNSAHIVMDQVYGFDQGYNALEAMAKGKVVFTGAEQEWLDYYNLEADTVAINALPDAEKIAEKLEWLILNPEKILEISKNARAFIEREHDYKKVAETYLNVWNSKQ